MTNMAMILGKKDNRQPSKLHDGNSDDDDDGDKSQIILNLYAIIWVKYYTDASHLIIFHNSGHVDYYHYLIDKELLERSINLFKVTQLVGGPFLT